jgi:hypothetical protein
MISTPLPGRDALCETKVVCAAVGEWEPEGNCVFRLSVAGNGMLSMSLRRRRDAVVIVAEGEQFRALGLGRLKAMMASPVVID